MLKRRSVHQRRGNPQFTCVRSAMTRLFSCHSVVLMDESRLNSDVPEEELDDIEGRIPEPFPLVRYYLIASVTLVLVTFGLLTILSIRIERNSIINRLEDEASVAVQQLALDMSLAVSSVAGPDDELAEQFASRKTELDRATLNAVRGAPIVRIDLLTPQGELIYSTDKDAVTPITSGELQSAVSGANISRYIEDEPVTLFNGEGRDVDTVITAAPLSAEWSVGSGAPVAILVAHRDVTAAVAGATSSSTWLRLGSVAGPLLLLFLVLLWIVARGQKFTAQAREELSGMLRREIDIRQQLDLRNAELQQANRAKSQFLSMVSHELKTPLTAIIAFSNRLNKKLGPSLDDRESRQLDAVARNGRQLNGLIEDLLDVSAAESGQLKLSFEKLRLSELIQQSIDLSQPLMDSKSQSLIIDEAANDEVEIVGDMGRLQQAVTNLLSNASKYSPESAQIALSIEINDDDLELSVTDQGIGISDEDMKMLFSAFFRTSNAVSSGAPGTGLGLVVVRSIVEGHGGQIDVKSSMGLGSTFTIRIPLDAGKSQVIASDGLDILEDSAA